MKDGVKKLESLGGENYMIIHFYLIPGVTDRQTDRHASCAYVTL